MIRGEIFNSATIEGMLAAPGEKWHRDPPDVIPLFLADPDFPVAPAIKRELLNAIHDEDLFYNYDDKAREAMAAKIVRRNGLEATADDIMITQGVNPGLWVAIKHTCKAGDEVIVADPIYHRFFDAIEITNTKPVHWTLDMEDGYRFDDEKLKDLVTSKTKLIFVCNPHNPCGRVMTEEELKALADIAVDNGIAVMVDEIWEDIVFDDRKHITLASLNPDIERLTMTSFGFSKTFCVAGLQMGYLCVTNKEMMAKLKRAPWGVLMRGTSTLAMAAAPVMLGNTLDWWVEDMMKHLHKIRAICEKRFEETPGITGSKLEGTYLMFPKFDYGMTSEELERHMFKEARLRFAAGTDYGPQGEGHLRMCVATSEAIINEVFDRMQKALEKLK